MHLLKLINQHNISINFRLGKEIGSGADGEVFEIIDSPNVIKFSILYDCGHTSLSDYDRISKTLNYLIDHSPQPYARIYEHKYLGQFERDGYQKHILYYYVMEKLNHISDDETKVFHSILSHEDRQVKKNYQKINKILNGLSAGLDFDEKEVKLFVASLVACVIKQNDIHPRNIMKNNLGQFRFIDVDRCQMEKI